MEVLQPILVIKKKYDHTTVSALLKELRGLGYEKGS